MDSCTVLLENSHENFAHAKSSHGLSLFIEVDNKKILFDCGPNEDFISNSILLKKNLNEVDSVILSHAHYDHSCGYRYFVEDFRCKELVCGDKFFIDKYALIDGAYYFRGVNFDKKFLNTNSIQIKSVDKELKIGKRLFVYSNIENSEDYETFPNKYFIDTGNGYVNDKFLDETVLVIENENDLTLIVGCSHPGIVSIIKSVNSFHDKKVKTIIGGLHLAKVKKSRIKKTVEALEELGVEKVFLGHCTGSKVIAYINENSNKIEAHGFSTGAIIEI